MRPPPLSRSCLRRLGLPPVASGVWSYVHFLLNLRITINARLPNPRARGHGQLRESATHVLLPVGELRCRAIAKRVT